MNIDSDCGSICCKKCFSKLRTRYTLLCKEKLIKRWRHKGLPEEHENIKNI